MVGSCHVTFDQSRSPGTHYLDHNMYDESISDNTYSDEDMSATISDNLSIDKVHKVVPNPESCTSDPSDAPIHDTGLCTIDY